MPSTTLTIGGHVLNIEYAGSCGEIDSIDSVTTSGSIYDLLPVSTQDAIIMACHEDMQPGSDYDGED